MKENTNNDKLSEEILKTKIRTEAKLIDKFADWKYTFEEKFRFIEDEIDIRRESLKIEIDRLKQPFKKLKYSNIPSNVGIYEKLYQYIKSDKRVQKGSNSKVIHKDDIGLFITQKMVIEKIKIALNENDKKRAHNFLTKLVDYDIEDEKSGQTLLHYALENKHLHLARLLIEKGADINAEDCKGNSALHIAVRKSNGLTKLLVNKGADINAENDLGNTPLFDALTNENYELVELLIKKGANVNHENFDGEVPLMLDIKDLEILKLLIYAGADIEAEDEQEETPIFYAIRNRRFDYIELLIHRGANINKEDDSGCTPLLLAIKYGLTTLIGYLISKGADVNHVNKRDKTPLAFAVKRRKRDIVRLLLKAGVKETVKHQSCLYDAIENQDFDMIEMLIEKGIDVNLKDRGNHTPLDYALYIRDLSDEQRLRLVKLFLSHGAKVRTCADNEKDCMFNCVSTLKNGPVRNEITRLFRETSNHHCWN